jgi:hypothetical protein
MARMLLTQAVEAEVSEFLAVTADLKSDDALRANDDETITPREFTLEG